MVKYAKRMRAINGNMTLSHGATQGMVKCAKRTRATGVQGWCMAV